MTTRRRILFAIRSYHPDQTGGASMSVRSLAEALCERGHDVHIVRLVPAGTEARYRAEAARAGVIGPGKPQLHFLPIRNVYWPYDGTAHGKLTKAAWHLLDLHNPLAARDFRRLLERVRPDVVNTSVIDGFSTAIFAEVKRSGAKLVHTMRDYYLVCARSGMFRDSKRCEGLCQECRLVQQVNRRKTRHVDMFLSNSAFVADAHRRLDGFGADKPCAVQWNVNDRPPVAGPRRPGETLRFGFIGRIAPSKGLERLLAAAKLLAGGGRPWSLSVAGDGAPAYRTSLEASVAGLPNVRFLGWQSATAFYEQVDVVICPSIYHEPLPRVIYEAYGFALPVIASRVGGNPEVVVPGETGELFDAQDAEDLAGAMEHFRQLSDTGYARYSERALALGARFAPGPVVDAYERQIDSLFTAGAA